MKVLVGVSNQKALVGALSVIVKTDGSSTAHPGTGYAEEKPGARPRLPGRRRADTGRREELPQSVARVQPSSAGPDIYTDIYISTNIYRYLDTVNTR